MNSAELIKAYTDLFSPLNINQRYEVVERASLSPVQQLRFDLFVGEGIDRKEFGVVGENVATCADLQGVSPSAILESLSGGIKLLRNARSDFDF